MFSLQMMKYILDHDNPEQRETKAVKACVNDDAIKHTLASIKNDTNFFLKLFQLKPLTEADK